MYLFINAVSGRDYTASNCRMINENQLERMWKEM